MNVLVILQTFSFLYIDLEARLCNKDMYFEMQFIFYTEASKDPPSPVVAVKICSYY